MQVSVSNLDDLQGFVGLTFHGKLRYCQGLVGLVICAAGIRIPVQELCLFRLTPDKERSKTNLHLFHIMLPQAVSRCQTTFSTTVCNLCGPVITMVTRLEKDLSLRKTGVEDGQLVD